MAGFRRGDSVVWRSLPMGEVGYVFAATIVDVSDDVVVLFQPAGAPCMRRVGKRGGPQGRSMLPGGAAGHHALAAFGGPSALRLHPCGRSYSVIRRWDEDRRQPVGWYINLESPWQQTRIGFDSCDLVLDIVADDDLTSWSMKDEDELAWAAEVGKLSHMDVQQIRAEAEVVVRRLESRGWPFTDEAWRGYTPSADFAFPALAVGWDVPEC